MKIIIAGAGEIGKALINILVNEKHEVTLIEKDESLSESIAEDTDILVIQGDATEMNILNDAGIEKSDAFIAVTNDDKTNLMISEIALSTNIKKVISRVNLPENEELFVKLGITNITPIVDLAIESIKKSLYEEGEKTKKRIIAEFGKGDLEIIEATVNKESSLIGKPLKIQKGVLCAVYRNGQYGLPKKFHEIKEGDVLVVSAEAKDVEGIIKTINP